METERTDKVKKKPVCWGGDSEHVLDSWSDDGIDGVEVPSLYQTFHPYPVQVTDNSRGYYIRIFSNEENVWITGTEFLNKECLDYYEYIPTPKLVTSAEYWLYVKSVSENGKGFHIYMSEEHIELYKRDLRAMK